MNAENESEQAGEGCVSEVGDLAASGPDPQQAPRGAWAWWWAHAICLIVLLAVLVAAVVTGRSSWLALTTLAVSLVGFTTALLGFRQNRRSPPPVAPREVVRAMDRAEPRERRRVLREARRGRTVDGPLATASRWHRDHRFTAGGTLRLPYGLGLSLAIAANTTGQLVGGTFARTGLLVIMGVFVAVLLGIVVVGLGHHWILLTHHVPRPGEVSPARRAPGGGHGGTAPSEPTG